jgi:hypothetical protein
VVSSSAKEWEGAGKNERLFLLPGVCVQWIYAREYHIVHPKTALSVKDMRGLVFG